MNELDKDKIIEKVKSEDIINCEDNKSIKRFKE